MKSSKEHLFFIDALRSYAIVTVVLSHSIATFVGRIDKTSFVSWVVFVVANAFLRSAVPLFVMISGSLALKPEPISDWKAFFKRRLTRVLLPTISWSIIYVAWNMHAGIEPQWSRRILLDLVATPASLHLWYMYMFCVLVLATPLFRVFLKAAAPRDVWYAIALWGVSATFLIYMKEVFHAGVSEWFYLPFGYWGYYLLGYALIHATVRPARRRWLLAGAVVLMALTAAGTIWLSTRNGWVYNGFLFDNLGWNQIIISGCLFMAFMATDFTAFFERHPIWRRIVADLGHQSFGIYLAHMLVLQFLAWGYFGFRLSYWTIHPLIGAPLTAMAMLFVSWAGVRIVARIPGLNVLLLGRGERV